MITTTALANTVSAYATVLSGVLALILTALMGAQPRRWRAAYLCVFITGVPTVWYHGFGETFVSGFFDIATNLLLGWVLTVAALGDYYRPRTQRWVALGLGGLDIAALVSRLIQGPMGARTLTVQLGAFGGFTLLELTLILNSVLAVGLLYARYRRVPPRARPVLHLLTGIFIVGALLATATNHRVDFEIVAWHATWHIVGAFGFMVLWAFNHMRFVMTNLDEVRIAQETSAT